MSAIINERESAMTPTEAWLATSSQRHVYRMRVMAAGLAMVTATALLMLAVVVWP